MEGPRADLLQRYDVINMIGNDKILFSATIKLYSQPDFLNSSTE